MTDATDLPPPGAPDIDIARAATLRPIAALARERLGLEADDLVPYGHHIAKLSPDAVQAASARPAGKLVLVTAVSPTPAGEGKTTTSVGLNDGLNRLGVKSVVCLREPSLGPVFGMKGGAAGGGRAQVLPMEQINLHFTGDLHAISAAHALVSAVLDNHLHWGNALDIDPNRISWRRAVDMNDRALRDVVVGMGGNGVVREDGFDITVASEIMAVFCLATDLTDLQKRIGDMVVGETRGTAKTRKPVTVRDLGADGAVTVLLRDAFSPNLVQSVENNPALIHGGPFANIAHGCNSVVATRTALGLADVVVTEAGFGADLGAEKFLNIKCRQTGLRPDACVLVATVRSMRFQGGAKVDALNTPDADAVARGVVNLSRHIQNMKAFGLTPVVALNAFASDTQAEVEILREAARAEGARLVLANHWAEGGAGAEDLARAVMAALDGPAPDIRLLYREKDSLADKVRSVATIIYRADDVVFLPAARAARRQIERMGYGHLPVCIAKTQSSFSTDPKARGAASGHTLEVRDVVLNAGAGFVVMVCGDILRMPGLPRRPAALDIGLDGEGRITGLS